MLVDADGKNADDVLRPFREGLPFRIGTTINAQLQFACAKWHLEAGYFGDYEGLRGYLGRDPGSVASSDEIHRPKGHLMNLLGERAYTAVISEEIAKGLDPQTISCRSPSFHGFVEAVRNGKARSGDQTGQ